MGLTISWDWPSSDSSDESESIIEHLEAKGQNQIDFFLKMLKNDGRERRSP